jgi:23S rRNA (uracil1939-C5)-methyltransferase
MGRSRKPRLPEGSFEVEIRNLSPEGRGVAQVEGKAVFIPGALAGELVRFRYSARHRRHDEGRLESVLRPSPDRVVPRCAHADICGGCSLQHLSSSAQLRDKQEALLETMSRLGGVVPEQLLPPLESPSHWGYRQKARLGVKWVEKKGRVLVGFREQRSGFIADIQHCAVLDERVGSLLEPLARLIEGLSIRERLPQIEVATSDAEAVLILRVLSEPSAQDRAALCNFAAAHGIRFGVQSAGPESIRSLCDQEPLSQSYSLADFGIEIGFEPTDFTQVNAALNRLMVRQALELLDPKTDDTVLDLFCGLGNFTLPLATLAGQVTGVEGDAGLIERARANARCNGLENICFEVANLYEPQDGAAWLKQRYTKALIDPPRSGAAEILGLLPKLGVQRLVYVSCYPATLARDAGILVKEHGYKLKQLGVMDMFPHTAHVESIALFERSK